MRKKERQEKLVDLIRMKRISSQNELLAELTARGIHANQASISRDLNELGIAKLSGVYSLPQIREGDSALTDFLEIDTAGDHLLVVKTSPGKAMAVAIALDTLKLEEVVGTLAGDDTIFVATKSGIHQKGAIQKIISNLRRKK